MRDAGDILFDDGAGIEVCRDIVARGTDDLHAPLVGLMIGLRPDEGRQERVVDINNVVRIFGYHLVADNLHVSGQYNERNVLFF